MVVHLVVDVITVWSHGSPFEGISANFIHVKNIKLVNKKFILVNLLSEVIIDLSYGNRLYAMKN